MPPILKFAAVAALFLTAIAPVAPAQAQSAVEPRSCFYARDISSFSVVDDHTVYLRVGVDHIYRLDLMGNCINLQFRQHLGVESTPAGASICSALNIELIDRDNGFPQTCPVTTLHALTPLEAAALPKKDRP